jgi:hypothetical protein
LSRKKLIGREVRNSGSDGGLFRGPGPEFLGIILPDQRQFHGPGSGSTANCVETGSAQLGYG